jgi:hypothetical protein
VWILASLSFGVYVANIGSYNKTYGSMAGVIILLLWLWLTNLALLFGAEVDAELERSRQLQAGIEAEETLQLPPRDTRRAEQEAAKLQAQIDEGRQLRESLAAEEPDEDHRGGSRVPGPTATHEDGETTMADEQARKTERQAEASKLLAIYLRDHLAGAAAGTGLAARCRKNNRGTAYEEELAAIERQIREDRESLQAIMAACGVEPNRFKTVIANVAEFGARLKSNGRLTRYSPSSRVVELEALAAGVTTKRNLWRALRSATPGAPDAGLGDLEDRATEQLERLAKLHDRACAEAFSPRT